MSEGRSSVEAGQAKVGGRMVSTLAALALGSVTVLGEAAPHFSWREENGSRRGDPVKENRAGMPTASCPGISGFV